MFTNADLAAFFSKPMTAEELAEWRKPKNAWDRKLEAIEADAKANPRPKWPRLAPVR